LIRQLLLGSVSAVVFVSSAAAQVPHQVFRDIFGTMQQLHRVQQMPPPVAPRAIVSAPQQDLARIAGQQSISSSKPTINCSKSQTPLPLILCSEENAAKADWDVNAAAWAYASLLEDDARKTFWGNHQAWITSISAHCSLTLAMTRSQRDCVVSAYRGRAKALQSELKGDALAEARLTPEQRTEIQARLISLGHLSGEPDGEFGPKTRAAIREFQRVNRLQESAYLTAQQRQTLLTPPVESPSPIPPTTAPEVPQAPQPSGGRLSQSQPSRFPTAPIGQAHTPSLGGREDTGPPPTPGRPPQPRFPTAPNGQGDAPLMPSPQAIQTGPTRTVTITASAETPDAARKDAARLAIQQVAGVYIDNRRRVESNMSNEKVSEIVEEKLLSYTNAYVSRIEVISTDYKDGVHTTTAKVTVAIAPILKTLQESNVPTVPFDTISGAATAETLGTQKAEALAIYNDLVSRLDNLIQVGVGKAEVSTSIPGPVDSVWLSVPVTFFANADAINEWRRKFELIADPDKRKQEIFKTWWYRVGHENDGGFERGGCSAQSIRFYGSPFRTTPRPVSACFISSTTGDGRGQAISDCFGRTFVEARGDEISRRASSMKLVIDLLDKGGNAVRSLQLPFKNFPQIAVENSRTSPPSGHAAFFNYCAENSRLFFSSSDEAIVFPPVGSRINTMLNILLPNEQVAQIATIRARLTSFP